MFVEDGLIMLLALATAIIRVRLRLIMRVRCLVISTGHATPLRYYYVDDAEMLSQALVTGDIIGGRREPAMIVTSRRMRIINDGDATCLRHCH